MVGLILVLGAGVVGGIWLTRATEQSDDERRDQQLQAFRSLVVKQALAPTDDDASTLAGDPLDPVDSVDQGSSVVRVPTKRRPLKRRPLKLQVVSKPLRRTCRLKVKAGPRGAAVFIDGQLKGTLPLVETLKAPAGAPFVVKVSRADMDPYVRRLTCEPGQVLVLKLGLTPTR